MRKNERLVRVRVIPNSDRSSIRRKEDEIKVKVASPAEKGKANKELLRILYRTFGTRDIEIVSGKTKRRKIVRIRGDGDTVDRILDGLLTDGS